MLVIVDDAENPDEECPGTTNQFGYCTDFAFTKVSVQVPGENPVDLCIGCAVAAIRHHRNLLSL